MRDTAMDKGEVLNECVRHGGHRYKNVAKYRQM